MAEPAECKKFVMVGHVDHGKSTFCGRVLYDSGYVQEHQMDELRKRAKANKKQGWEFAYILDIFEDEQERGKTMDYTSVDFTRKGKNYTLVDTPGHKHLIRTLITGLNHYDTTNMVGCLAVSCAENEFEGGLSNGQTKEDILLLRASGIENLIVLINKMDLVDWNMEIFKSRQERLDTHIKKFGFKRVEYLGASAYQGRGIDDFFNLLDSFKLDNDKVELEQQELCEQIVIQLKVLYDDTFDKLITTGFTLVLHVRQSEYQVTIDGFKHYDTKTRKIVSKIGGNYVMKNGDVVLAKVSIIVEPGSKKEKFYIGLKDRVILRSEDSTIAFGRVYKMVGSGSD